jgi:hypothetical protein
MSAVRRVADVAEAAAYSEALRRRGRPVVTLPDDDPVIDGAEPGLRRKVGETWRRRAHEELKAAMAFTLLSRELLAVGAAPEAMARVARAVGDEVRHAEALRALASRYLGEEVAWPPAVDVEVGPLGPRPRERASRHAVALCCFSETIASVFFEASHDAAVSPSARATLGLVLADEVEHARAGWVYLASLRGDPEVTGALQASLAPLVREVVEEWFDFSAITLPDGAHDHGLLANAEVRRCVITALRDLVLPGFASMGFDVSGAADAVADARARCAQLDARASSP